MARLIDADALIAWIKGSQQMTSKMKCVIAKIETMPDAVSVVHGEWICHEGKWIDCKEPPSTDRNVFIAYGTDDMKSVCIGHYKHDMKLWYEDKNFFAKPIYDAMCWCEIPQFPAKMKGADDE